MLGVLSANNSWKWAGCDYASAELFERFYDRLQAGEEIVAIRPHLGRPLPSPHDAFGAFETGLDLAAAAGAAREATVEICNGETAVALGLVVDAAGRIVTKRSEVQSCEKLHCRTVDGRDLPCRIVGEAMEHDVALLATDVPDLKAARWANDSAEVIGQIVASIGLAATPLHFGAVCGIGVKNPAVPGQLPINGQEKSPEGESGLAFTKVWDHRPDVGRLREQLHEGDYIVQIDGTPTPTPEHFVTARNARLGRADAIIGERIALEVRRGSETRRVFAPLISEVNVTEFEWKQSPLSLRRNGFPRVFSHDGGIAPHQCGGPVVNLQGEVVGINIARADAVQSFVIPTRLLKKLIADLSNDSRSN